jgi:hypothetical protein
MKTAWWVVVVVGIAPLAACKDKPAPGSQSPPEPAGAMSPPPSAPSPSPAAQNPYWAAQDICALVPADKVVTAVGGTEARAEAETSSPPSCRYFFRLENRQSSATVQMMDGFDLERSALGDKAVPVPALGDDAWSHAHTDSTVLYVRRGALVFSVNVSGVEDANRLAVGKSVAGVVLATLK